MNLDHGLTRRAGALLLAMALLAACGGGGGDGDVSSEGTTKSTAGADGIEVGDESTDASAGASGDTTTTKGAAQTSTGGSSSTTTAAPAKVADDTPGLQPAGEYRYHTTGTSKLGANPSQPINVDTTTTVVHLGNGKVRQTGDDQETVLELKGSQLLLHTMDLTRPGFERHFEAKPPIQYAPVPLKVGQKWAWKLTATNFPTTVDQDSRVDRLETITVGGKTINAIVVVTRVTLSGDVSGTIDLTMWIDTATNIPSRIHAKTNIVTFAFTSDTTSDFTGFTPR